MSWWTLFTAMTAGMVVGILLATSITYNTYYKRSQEVIRLADNVKELNTTLMQILRERTND